MLIEIAKEDEEVWSYIPEEIGVPRHFISKILTTLRPEYIQKMILNLNNPKEVEDKADKNAMKTRYGGKDGIYESLINTGGYYLPAFMDCTLSFMVAILKGEKKALKKSEVIECKVPGF